ncbi:MAG: helix-turn-helix domain-containing protein [Nitrospirales bacterium]
MKSQPITEQNVRLFSERDAAAYLGISYWTVRDLRFRGELPGIKIGRRILIDKQDLDAYIARLKKVEGP